MKKLLPLSLLFLVPFLLPHPGSGAAPPTVALSKNGILLNGIELNQGSRPGDVEKILGKPSRASTKRAEKIVLDWTYDSAGVRVVFKGSTNKLSFITFHFARVPDKADEPSFPFRGRVQVGSKTIEASTTLDEAGRLMLSAGGIHELRLGFGVWIIKFPAYTVSFEEIRAPSLQNMGISFNTAPY